MKIYKNLFIFIALILISKLATGQDNCYIKLTDYPKDKDFKEIWTNKSFEGVIGNSNQRIQIRFLRVTNEEKSLGTYLIKGKSKVNNNICDFSGYLIINEVFQLDNLNDKCEGPSYASGYVKGTYEFKEDIEQNHVGIFKGEFTTFWVSDGSKISGYDGWYTKEGTNQFVGIWNEYNSNQNKFCSWGLQVPPSKDKDLFRKYENEFYIFNNKYIDKGWKSYVYANLDKWIIVPNKFETNKTRILDDFLQIKMSEILNARELESIEWWD